ncbi:Hypothetical predicted protein [Octopus vulgaris]|uniref:Uncharacterized protein n=1 Tax=Octopus vulgaris TaxID=6645 RepID=A0AA36APM7_OCTVU|nr:Hypothetical predicted protein [Octopus vulgaris]
MGFRVASGIRPELWRQDTLPAKPYRPYIKNCVGSILAQSHFATRRDSGPTYSSMLGRCEILVDISPMSYSYEGDIGPI